MTPRGPWLKSLLREPLLHFVLVAAALLTAHRIYASRSLPELKITPEWLETLARDFETRAGRKPDAPERARLAREYLEEEILFREARKAGLDEDPRVRHLLALAMRESLEPVIADPSDAELKELRAKDPASYRFPAGVRFEHASFPAAAEVPAGLLEKLRAGESPPFSSAMHLPSPMPMTWLPQIERMFGQEFAAAVSACKTGEWSGPLKSSRGVHFVKVLESTPPRDMPLGEVRTALSNQWITGRQKAAVSAKVAEFARGYHIALPPEIPAP